MKTVFGRIFVVAALVAIPLASQAAPRQTSTTPAGDHRLGERIEKRIDASSIKKFGVHVSVDVGVATLTGVVATDAERRRATQLATIPGVLRVDNQIVVDPEAKGTLTARTKAGAEKVVDKTKAGTEKVVDKTKEGLSKTGEVITDAWITTRVRSKFVGEDLLKDSNIDVDTADHVVTLRGTVMSAAGRARAGEPAQEVGGGLRVADFLMIGSKKS
jgi:osmotically-inducible protein OsmY